MHVTRRTIGGALAVIAGTAALAIPAGADAMKLHLTEPTWGVATPTTRIGLELNLSLATQHGTLNCILRSDGYVSPPAGYVKFEPTYQVSLCSGPGLETEGATGLRSVRFSVYGRALANVAIPVKRPSPAEACEYIGTLKGTNTTSGFLQADFEGVLRTRHCHERPVAATTTYWYANGPGPNWEEFEALVY